MELSSILRPVCNSQCERWTPATIECYKRGCSCKGCDYENILESTYCHGKSVVLELVRVLGIPEGIESKGVIE